MSTTAHGGKGLEGITAANSSICFIDGDQGVLAYRGIDIHTLADQSNFEGILLSALVWTPAQPRPVAGVEAGPGTRAQTGRLHHKYVAAGPPTRAAHGRSAHHRFVLPYYDPEEKVNDHEANLRKAVRLTAQIAYVVAAYDRIRKGKALIEPDRSLSHAGNFLYMLNGEIPSANPAEPSSTSPLSCTLIMS